MNDRIPPFVPATREEIEAEQVDENDPVVVRALVRYALLAWHPGHVPWRREQSWRSWWRGAPN